MKSVLRQLTDQSSFYLINCILRKLIQNFKSFLFLSLTKLTHLSEKG
jgi:hypothetical protein